MFYFEIILNQDISSYLMTHGNRERNVTFRKFWFVLCEFRNYEQIGLVLKFLWISNRP